MSSDTSVITNGRRLLIDDEYPVDICTDLRQPLKKGRSIQLGRQRESLLRGWYEYSCDRNGKRVHERVSTFRPHAALMPVLQRIATLHGIAIDDSVINVAAIRQPSENDDMGCRFTDPILNEFIYRCPGGVITHHAGVPTDELIAQAIRAYSGEPIAVVTGSHSEAKRLSHQLSSLTGRPVVFVEDGCYSPLTPGFTYGEACGDLVVVGVPKRFSDGQSLIQARKIVLFPEARQLTHQDAEQMLCYKDFRGRVFGFLDSNAKLTQREEDLIVAKVGFERINIPAHGFMDTTVFTAIQKATSRVPDARCVVPQRVRSQHVTNNKTRNRLIAKVAFETSQNRNVSQEHREQFGKPIVLCADLEHVVKLSWQLRDWPLIVAPNSDLNGLDGAVKRRIRASGPEQLLADDCPGCIASASALALLPSPLCRRIVWAGAGQDAPEFPRSWMMTQQNQPMNRFLLDFKDKASRILAHWSKRRLGQYRNREWLKPNERVVEYRIAQAAKRMARVEPHGGVS